MNKLSSGWSLLPTTEFQKRPRDDFKYGIWTLIISVPELLALKTQLRRSSSSAGVSQRTKTDANFSQQNQLLTTYFLRSSYLHNKLIRKNRFKRILIHSLTVFDSQEKKWRILSLHKDYTLSLFWLCLRVTGVSSTNVLVVYTPVPLVSCSSTSFID